MARTKEWSLTNPPDNISRASIFYEDTPDEEDAGKYYVLVVRATQHFETDEGDQRRMKLEHYKNLSISKAMYKKRWHGIGNAVWEEVPTNETLRKERFVEKTAVEGGVFLIVCDGTCNNCHLSECGWSDMNGNSPCNIMKHDEHILMIRHRTDIESAIHFDFPERERFEENHICARCGEFDHDLYCKQCAKKGVDKPYP